MKIFNTVKKAEIHVHLEATITPDLCKKFAMRNNHEIPEEMFVDFLQGISNKFAAHNYDLFKNNCNLKKR